LARESSKLARASLLLFRKRESAVADLCANLRCGIQDLIAAALRGLVIEKVRSRSCDSSDLLSAIAREDCLSIDNLILASAALE
jgi:hypothetical protein